MGACTNAVESSSSGLEQIKRQWPPAPVFLLYYAPRTCPYCDSEDLEFREADGRMDPQTGYVDDAELAICRNCDWSGHGDDTIQRTHLPDRSDAEYEESLDREDTDE